MMLKCILKRSYCRRWGLGSKPSFHISFTYRSNVCGVIIMKVFVLPLKSIYIYIYIYMFSSIIIKAAYMVSYCELPIIIRPRTG